MTSQAPTNITVAGMQRTRVCYRHKHTALVSCLGLLAERTKILMGRGKLAAVRIFTEQESHLFTGAPMELITSPHVQSVSKARKSPQLRSELAAFARQGGRGGRVQSTAIRYRFSLRVSVITLDTRPPSSQYVNQCVWHATMQRTKWHRDPVRGRSGPVVEALRAGARRHQLPPGSERKGTYSAACARKDNYCGQ